MRICHLIAVVGVLSVGCNHPNDGVHSGNDAGVPSDDGGTGVDGGDMTGGCGLVSCASSNASCGPIGDGCGGVLQCGDCPTGQTCGGGGTSFACGSGVGPGSGSCVPRSCKSAGVNCGPFSDGCGTLLDCGSCPMGQACGLGGPSICGDVPDAGASSCTNLCQHQQACSPGVTTTLTGTVVAGTDPTRFGAPDPVYNALVYVPNGTVQPFAPNVSCDQCGSPASGSPLVTATTGVDGKFTLTNVPCGVDVPLVIQLGRWRRQVTVPGVQCCQTKALTTEQTRLPRNHTEGDIPRIALATGNVDALECVLRKMGIDDSEFTNPSNGGRVQIYQANGAKVSSSTPNENQLWGSAKSLTPYDMVLFPCEGKQLNETLAAQQNIIDYTNNGGRVFATHFSYAWLVTAGTGKGALPGNPPAPAPFVDTAKWKVNQLTYDPFVTGIIDTSFQKGKDLAQWLKNVGASTTLGQIPVEVVRRDLDSVVSPSQSWLSSSSANTTQGNQDPNIPVVHYTFNTPVNSPASQQCGRVVFSDFHVENTSGASSKTFPAECGSDKPLTAQEKLLEFMLFDLGSCIAPDSGGGSGTCTPFTCAQLNAGCGLQGDGCGGTIDCHGCPTGQTCGGGGVPNQCGAPGCTPLTCQKAGANCGIIGDGCGSTVDCGPCPTGQTCGGAGIANQCSPPIS